jgi:hypothetical protein
LVIARVFNKLQLLGIEQPSRRTCPLHLAEFEQQKKGFPKEALLFGALQSQKDLEEPDHSDYRGVFLPSL